MLLGLGVTLLVLLVSLPFMARTGTYPIAIVNGNSMYPTLQNGALVFFTASAAPIQNGSIIVFVQTQSGFPVLDSVLEPVLIHRVIGVGQEPDGQTYYKTKGDNNEVPDPFVTDSSDVLGVPALVIPDAGFPLLFAKSSFGMISITAMLSLYFFSEVDTKIEEESEKKRLIAVFARHSLNGEISPAQFERLKLAVEYYDEMSIDLLNDPTILSTVDWLKGGGLEKDWKEEPRICERCGRVSFTIVAGDTALVVCPSCSELRPSRGGDQG
jgi:signal peptidase I